MCKEAETTREIPKQKQIHGVCRPRKGAERRKHTKNSMTARGGCGEGARRQKGADMERKTDDGTTLSEVACSPPPFHG